MRDASTKEFFRPPKKWSRASIITLLVNEVRLIYLNQAILEAIYIKFYVGMYTEAFVGRSIAILPVIIINYVFGCVLETIKIILKILI